MKSSIGSGLMTILASLVCMQSTGCSLIGYNIGKSAETQEFDVAHLRASGGPDIERGAAIEVTMSNGESFRGRYLEVRLPDREAYTSASADLADPFRDAGWRPSLNDQIQVTVATEGGKRTYRGMFSGLNASALWVRQSADSKPYGINLKSILQIKDSLDRYIGGDTLRQNLPEPRDQRQFTRMLIVTGAEDTVLLPLDEVEVIHLPGAHGARWIGLGVGAAVDIAVVAILITAVNKGVEEAFTPLPLY